MEAGAKAEAVLAINKAVKVLNIMVVVVVVCLKRRSILAVVAIESTLPPRDLCRLEPLSVGIATPSS